IGKRTLTVSGYLPRQRAQPLRRPRRPDAPRDLRAAGRRPEGRLRARARAPGQSARGVAAPQGAEGGRLGARQRAWDAAALPERPARRRRAAGVRRPLLDPRPGRLQGGGREPRHGGSTMTQQATGMSVRKSVTVEAAPEWAFEVFTERMADWWPLDTHHIAEKPAVDARFEG